MELQCQYAFNGPSLVYNKTLHTCIRFLFPENAMYSLQISRLASQWLAFAASKMQTWLRKNISPIGNTPTANLISNGTTSARISSCLVHSWRIRASYLPVTQKAINTAYGWCKYTLKLIWGVCFFSKSTDLGYALCSRVKFLQGGTNRHSALWCNPPNQNIYGREELKNLHKWIETELALKAPDF